MGAAKPVRAEVAPAEAESPMVANAPALACFSCGAVPRSAEIGGFDRNGWRCDACLEAAGLGWVTRLLTAAERAVLSPDALADEAKLTTHGEPLP
jgi:hypothetical protein